MLGGISNPVKLWMVYFTVMYTYVDTVASAFSDFSSISFSTGSSWSCGIGFLLSETARDLIYKLQSPFVDVLFAR